MVVVSMASFVCILIWQRSRAIIKCLDRRNLPLPASNNQRYQTLLVFPTQNVLGDKFEKVVNMPSGAELRGGHIEEGLGDVAVSCGGFGVAAAALRDAVSDAPWFSGWL